MRNLFAKLAILVTLFIGVSSAVSAQDINTAVLNGVVTDASGAVVPDAQLTLSNPSKGLSFKAKSNSAGSYRFANIPPGPGYQLEASREGFATVTVKAMYLNVNNSRTQNVSLTPGSNVEISVSAASQGVTLNTENATVGNNVQVEQLNALPIQLRNSPSVLFTLQPGVTPGGSTTGARTDQNNLSVDGLDVNDFATGSGSTGGGSGSFSIVGSAPVDAIQEYRGTVAGFQANSGPGGGGQFNLISRSGTNHFHGNVNLYHRDRSTVANTYFNNLNGIARPQLIRNQFGGNLGGPILHDKFFFFVNTYFQRIAQSSPVSRTVPLNSYRNGIVQYINNGTGCTSGSRQDTTPGCISQLSKSQVRDLDPRSQSTDPAVVATAGESQALLAFINNAYPQANDLSLGDGVNTGGYRFNALLPDNQSSYWSRIDYHLTKNINIFGRGSFIRRDAVQTSQQFPTSPVLTAPFSDRSHAWVGGVDWTIGNNKVNRFYLGQNIADFSFPVTYNPQGTTPVSFSTGTTTLLSDPYKTPVNAQARRVPIWQATDDFTWTKGRHSISLGGTFKWIHTFSTTKLDYATQAIGLGGKISTLNASLRPKDVLTTSTSSVRYDSAFAAALGRIGSITGKVNFDNQGKPLNFGTGANREYQYYQTAVYGSDTWKVTPNLTVTFGLNYQYFSVPYEVHGLETVTQFTFDDYFFGKRVAAANAGTVGNNAVPLFTYVLGGPANHGPSLYEPDWKDYAPSVGFSWNPSFDTKAVWNGSLGMVYDRTVVNAVQYQQDQYSYVFQQPLTISNGVSADPVTSLLQDPRYGSPNITLPAAPSTPYTPYVSSTGVPNGLQNGSAFNTTISRDFKTPYNIIATFGTQRELPGNFVWRANYVGRFGRRLLGQADTEQIIDFTDPGSGQKLGDAFAAMTNYVRANPSANYKNSPAQPFFENQLHFTAPSSYANKTSYVIYNLATLVGYGDFADTMQAFSPYLSPNVAMAPQFSENTMYTNKGFSTYHGFLTSLSKNMSHGLQFDVNYTWSHSIDNVSLIANSGAAAGYGFICDAAHPRLCRGESDFDAKHVINSNFTYQLPLGRGRTFLSKTPHALDYVIGGWDISGLVFWRSGIPFSTGTNAFVPGYSNNTQGIFNGNTAAIRTKIHKNPANPKQIFLFADPAAAAGAFSGPVGFQIGSRNNLRGPHFSDVDFGLAKNFAIWPDKGVKFQVRGDAFNVFNHPNFNTPLTNGTSSDITAPGTFGQLTATPGTDSSGGPRVVQVSGRIEF